MLLGGGGGAVLQVEVGAQGSKCKAANGATHCRANVGLGSSRGGGGNDACREKRGWGGEWGQVRGTLMSPAYSQALVSAPPEYRVLLQPVGAATTLCTGPLQSGV